MRIMEQDSAHSERIGGFDVGGHIVHKNRLACPDIGLFQSKLIDLWLRLHHTYLCRDRDAVEGVIEFMFVDIRAQVGPRVGNHAGFIARAERADKIQQVFVNNIAGEEFVMDGSGFGSGASQCARDCDPMLVYADGAERGPAAGVTFEDGLIHFFISQIQALREMLAGRLIFGTQNDPPNVKENGFNRHSA